MAVRRRAHGNGLDAWPGYVDALSTLLMVIIFVLLVFVLAQAFLSVALSGRSKELDKATAQLAELANALSLERSHVSELQLSISQLNKQLGVATSSRDSLSQELAKLKTAQAALLAERDRLGQQLADAQLAVQTAELANHKLTADLSDTQAQLQAAQQQAADSKAQLTTTQAQLQAANQSTADTRKQLDDTAQQLAAAQARLAATQQQIASMQQQIAELDKNVQVGKDTIEAKVSELAKLSDQLRALTALRDQLEKQAQDAAARAMTEADRRKAVEAQLSDEKKLGDSAKAQLALLNQQIDQLKDQLAAVSKALDLAEQSGRDKDAQIANLGQRLNAALAAKVEELQQYRSEFFGKLRQLLANRSGIQVVGDRFVFQSEVLFPVGSADLTPAGEAQMTTLAVTIKDIAAEIPANLPWILRVDGHTDPQPVKGGQFVSNWELSAARAITVVKLLIKDGVPAEHLAATAFGQYQPFSQGDSTEDYAKDRRIELRLTDR